MSVDGTGDLLSEPQVHILNVNLSSSPDRTLQGASEALNMAAKTDGYKCILRLLSKFLFQFEFWPFLLHLHVSNVSA